jgi:hypothetical protein
MFQGSGIRKLARACFIDRFVKGHDFTDCEKTLQGSQEVVVGQFESALKGHDFSRAEKGRKIEVFLTPEGFQLANQATYETRADQSATTET